MHHDDEHADPAQLLVRNEFASVVVELLRSRGGTCLRVADARTGVAAVIDPIVLEVLAWATREEIEAFTLEVLRRSTRLPAHPDLP